ncbi:MAG: hypothetical protein Q4G16_08120, partial [Cruoricaptor ignavus]|nr:hypothetical protein [Cruoricaptor ignavus]
MKYLFQIFFLLSCVFINAQQEKYVLIDSETGKKYPKKDSVSAVRFLDSLAQNHYFFTELKDIKQVGNQTKIYFDKGQNYNAATVSISDSIAKILKTEPEFFTKNLDSSKTKILDLFIDKGFTFSRIQTQYLGMKNGKPKVKLTVIPDKKRVIDGFAVRGYDKVPTRFLKNLSKEFLGKNYDAKTLLAVQQRLQNHQYIALERSPQTLFKKDSTQIFLFLQKKKVNTFDGIIGFGNDRTEKFSFNGTLNVQFRNMFNRFEGISLFWQRNPDRGQTFDLRVEVPYLFKSNIGTDINVNIFRQDSTFANVKFLPAVYYNFSNRQKLGVRATLETSTVMDLLYTSAKDYNKKGVGFWYDYTAPSGIDLFLYQTKIRAEADMLFTQYTSPSLSAKQFRYFFLAEHNQPLRGNHYLNLKGETALLSSKNEFSTNELLRFGGWNSFRGFNENTLLADFYYFGNAEYRYLVGNQAFFDVFLQYGQMGNKSLNLSPKLYSFGLGFNFFLPIGLMSFQIS